MENKSKHIVIIANKCWTLFVARIDFIDYLKSKGYEITLIAKEDGHTKYLTDRKYNFISINFDVKGMNILKDFISLIHLIYLTKKIKPDLILNFTTKANIYGSIAARFNSIPVVNNIAGLGTLFMNFDFKTKILLTLYKISHKRVDFVFFQNNEDRDLFLKHKIINQEKTLRIPGSGVNLLKYLAEPPYLKQVKFIFISRLLKAKGIYELIKAAEVVKQKYPEAVFEILGFVNNDSPTSITLNEVEQWEKKGIIKYLGETQDVRPYIKNSTCVVFPSYYREGVPRVLLEASAMARPIITTDNIGCRDAVDHGFNGLLCKVKDHADLAEKIITFIQMSDTAKIEMGKSGRIKVEKEFDQNIVFNSYFKIIQELA